MMNGVELVAKQEEYRNQTISIVKQMTDEGTSKAVVAEAVGITMSELDSILKLVYRKNKTAGRPNFARRYF